MKISLFVFVLCCVCVCVFVEIVYTTFKSNNHRDNKQPVFNVIKSDFFLFFFESCFSSQSSQALINVISYKQRPITMLHAIQRIIPIKYKFCTKETNKIVQIN